MKKKDFLIIKPEKQECVLENSYFKDYSTFVLKDDVFDGKITLEQFDFVIDLCSKQTGLYNLIDNIEKWSEDISFSVGEYNYLQFDYNKLFVDPEFKCLTEEEKEANNEKINKVLSFLKETFSKKNTEFIEKKYHLSSKNDIIKKGIILNSMIDKKYEKEVILIPDKKYAYEDTKKLFITLEELEIVKTIHLEALALLENSV